MKNREESFPQRKKTKQPLCLVPGGSGHTKKEVKVVSSPQVTLGTCPTPDAWLRKPDIWNLCFCSSQGKGERLQAQSPGHVAALPGNKWCPPVRLVQWEPGHSPAQRTAGAGRLSQGFQS